MENINVESNESNSVPDNNNSAEQSSGSVVDKVKGYMDGNPISAKAVKVASALGIAGVLGASLADYKNTNTYENVKENPPISEPLENSSIIKSSSGGTNQSLPENIIDSKEKALSFEDVSWEDIEKWNELTPLKIEKKEDVIETTGETEILLIPVQKDFFYNTEEQPTLWKMSAGMNVEIQDIYYLEGENKQIVRFSILPNVMASKSVPIILLDNGHMENGEYVVDKKDYKETESKKVFSQFSYIAGENEVYPNKITNVLTAMENIAENQEKNGKFIKGQEYSYIDLIGLKNLQEFKDGLNSSNSVVKGGGVCAGATLLSNSLYELGLHTGVDWNDIVKEKWAHPAMYYVGPFSVNDFVTDATVELSTDPQKASYDFKWIQPEDAYLKIDISLIPNKLDISDTELSGIGGKSDAEVIVSLSFTDADPGNQSQKIRDFITAYGEYRDSGHTSISPLLVQGEKLNELSWDEPAAQVIMSYVYPEENTDLFEEEFKEDSYFSEIRELQNIVNDLPPAFEGNLGSYLKTTAWYANRNNKEDLRGALNILDYTNVPGQPLQCVGFAILLSALNDENLNVQNVGGAYSFGAGNSPAKTATELIPYKLFSNKYLMSASTGYGGLALASENMKIDDYEVGDLFIRADIGRIANGYSPDGDAISFHTGHVGAIIGKKIVDGKTVLLVADANRKNDGKIRIFEVTENNFYKIFGDPGVSKYIVRANTVENVDTTPTE